MKNLVAAFVFLFSSLQVVAETLACPANANDFTCLVCNCYFEGRGEPQEGRIAVAKAVLSRKENNQFPNSVCGVIFQKSQFSWTDDSHQNIINAQKPEQIKALRECREAVNTALDEGPNGLIYFYNPRKATPFWARTAQSCGRVGEHVFLVPRGNRCPAKLGSDNRGAGHGQQRSSGGGQTR